LQECIGYMFVVPQIIVSFRCIYDEYHPEYCKNVTPVLCIRNYFTALKAIIDMVITKPKWDSNPGCPLRRQTRYLLSKRGLFKERPTCFYETCEATIKTWKI
jgi:hypothetical protein